MNLETELFKRNHINLTKLENYGFKKENNTYKYTKKFMDNFEASITITKNGKVSGKIYDLSTNDEYTNFRVKDQIGEFVTQVREEYTNILINIRNNCFEQLYFTTEQANRITKLIIETYNDNPEFPWETAPGNAIFRNKTTKKWYALIANINKNKLDKNYSEEIEIINLKLSKEQIPHLLSKQGFYPAYHMNKKNWITIILDNTLPDKEIIEYIKESYKFSCTK